MWWKHLMKWMCQVLGKCSLLLWCNCWGKSNAFVFFFQLESLTEIYIVYIKQFSSILFSEIMVQLLGKIQCIRLLFPIRELSRNIHCIYQAIFQHSIFWNYGAIAGENSMHSSFFPIRELSRNVYCIYWAIFWHSISEIHVLHVVKLAVFTVTFLLLITILFI